jgi:branched-chain amino acid transport system substrate-binding protein
LLGAGLVWACAPPLGNGASSNEIVVASDFPTSGTDASVGQTEQNGAQFAFDTSAARAALERTGLTVRFQAYDDSVNGVHNPQKGADNVKAMAANLNLLGLVGPNNSGVAAAEIPLANRAGLAMVSPANTDECLTQDQPYCPDDLGYSQATLRPTGKNQYFRVAADDIKQARFMVDYAIDALHVNRFAVWDDSEPFGRGMADDYAKDATSRGAVVVSRTSYDRWTKRDFTDFLREAKDGGAQAIYVAGTSSSLACVPRGQWRAVFGSTDLYYLGPDGMADAQCISDAGSMATDHMYATLAVADATQSADPSVKAVVGAYRQKYPSPDDLGSYTFSAYDSMAVLLDAISRAAAANGGERPSRQQVVAALAGTRNFAGLTGFISFDEHGDTTAPTLQVKQVKGDRWVFVNQKAFPAGA